MLIHYLLSLIAAKKYNFLEKFIENLNILAFDEGGKRF